MEVEPEPYLQFFFFQYHQLSYFIIRQFILSIFFYLLFFPGEVCLFLHLGFTYTTYITVKIKSEFLDYLD